MRLKKSLLSIALLSCIGLSISTNAAAEGKLNIYCSVQNEVCEKMAQKFSQKYNVKTQFIRLSTGAALSKIKSEKERPQADIWYGGTIEPHFQAGELNLLTPYRSPKQAEIMPQFKKIMEEKGELTSIGYMIVLGIGANREKFKELGIKEYPKCWNDLLDPKYQDYIQIPDPRSSGAAYTFIATLVSLWGEDKAFEYLRKLDTNVSQYVKSSIENNNLSRGDAALTISFIHGYATEQQKGAPIDVILPCDGDSYSLGGISILNGARNLENAKLFMDWSLSAEAQELPWVEAQQYQIPTNVNAKASPNSVDPKKLTKLIEIDYNRFGSSEEGKRLVERWVNEIKLQEKLVQ